jgi:hypothetical protein
MYIYTVNYTLKKLRKELAGACCAVTAPYDKSYRATSSRVLLGSVGRHEPGVGLLQTQLLKDI